jgi:Zn-dependent protease
MIATAPPAARQRISTLFLVLVTVGVCGGVAMWRGYGSQKAGAFIFVIAAWLVILCLHEFSHALTAYRGGDHTVAEKGYLTLNPVRYGHPVLTLLLPLLALLLGRVPLPGGAVWIEGRLLHTRARDSLVSAAGPLVNVVSAVILLVTLNRLAPRDLSTGVTSIDPFTGAYTITAHTAFWAALSFIAFTQVSVAILNLLPIPGLDGYGVIAPWLPERWHRAIAPVQPYLLIGALLLLFWVPAVYTRFGEFTDWIMTSSGAPPGGSQLGYDLVKFWR